MARGERDALVIREERDPAWWHTIADHPEVAPSIYFAGRFDFDFVRSPEVTPLACMHGGFLFHNDELHALFLPEGRGHEAALGLRLATEEMFARGAESLSVREVERLRSSRPPKSHGWRIVGGFSTGPLGLSLRLWSLSLASWRASPAYKRMAACRLS